MCYVYPITKLKIHMKYWNLGGVSDLHLGCKLMIGSNTQVPCVSSILYIKLKILFNNFYIENKNWHLRLVVGRFACRFEPVSAWPPLAVPEECKQPSRETLQHTKKRTIACKTETSVTGLYVRLEPLFFFGGNGVIFLPICKFLFIFCFFYIWQFL